MCHFQPLDIGPSEEQEDSSGQTGAEYRSRSCVGAPQSAGNISTGNICVIVTVAIINTITQLIFVIYILDVSGCYVMVG